MSDLVHNQIETYGSDDVTNDSGVAGTTVSDALDNAAKQEYSSDRFNAFVSAPKTDVTGDSTAYPVIFEVETDDRGNNYDNTTGVYTCGSVAWYDFGCFIELGDLTASHTEGEIYFLYTIPSVATVKYYILRGNIGAMRTTTGTADRFAITGSLHNFKMLSGNTMEVGIDIAGGTKVIDVISNSYFAGSVKEIG